MPTDPAGPPIGNILLVGCGKMGGALLGGWIEQGIAPQNITIIEPNETALPGAMPAEIGVCAALDELSDDYRPQTVLFAVKPQIMADVAPPYARFADGAVFVSIAAGKTITNFEEMLGSDAAIIRIMPNTPAAIRRGISVACANASVSDAARDRVSCMLGAVGELAWIEDENLMDAVTAVSGSGPAYVFLLAECMAAAGIKAGLPEELAIALARATVSGSGELIRQSVETVGTLRQNVTSPGGTTEAALGVLMADDGLQKLMDTAIAAAAKRSEELAS